MNQHLIRRAFESALASWAAAQVPAIPVAWENVELAPQPAGSYVRAFLLPAPAQSLDLARAHRLDVGVFQVTLCTPTGNGPAEAEALAASLAAVFNPATPLLAAGLRVVITDPLSAGPAIPEPTHHLVACSVPYRADSVA